jgi:RNA polymerase sigma-70 factor (ECF subfamily)
LFDLHRDRVYRRALSLLENQHDAEDVTAGAFFELWRKRRSVRLVDGSPLPWLLVTVVNLSRNMRRSTSRYSRLLRATTRREAVEGPDAEPIEARDRLATALIQLAPVDGVLLVLTTLEGMPTAQAAEAVGMKPATARVRLHRARSRLRADLHDLDPNSLTAEGTN